MTVYVGYQIDYNSIMKQLNKDVARVSNRENLSLKSH